MSGLPDAMEINHDAVATRDINTRISNVAIENLDKLTKAANSRSRDDGIPVNNMFSILATGNHDMYVRLGDIKQDGTAKFRGRDSGDGYICDDFHKGKASSAKLDELTCVDVDLIQFKSYIEEGLEVPPESESVIGACLSKLGIKTELQKEAFLLFYGYWLDEGTLKYSSPNGWPLAVTVKQGKADDGKWLTNVLSRCQVKYSSYCTETKAHVVFEIKDPNWIELFSGDNLLKYTADDRAIRSLESQLSNDVLHQTPTTGKRMCKNESKAALGTSHHQVHGLSCKITSPPPSQLA